VAVTAVAFAVAPPQAELPPEAEVIPPEEAGEEEETEEPRLFRPPAVDAGPGSIDGAVFPSPFGPEVNMVEALPLPSVSFDGLSNQNNFTVFSVRNHPPDTVGDVGPSHYVEMVNNLYRVFDKQGNALTPPRSISSLFAPLGSSSPCSNHNSGDPIVLYDPLADRWLLSQFCLLATPFRHEMIAISQTPDPTGAYFLYDFMMPNDKFPDYPKLGVWHDAYTMTDVQFAPSAVGYEGTGVFAFDRVKMLQGDPTASYIYFDLGPLDPELGGVLPADLDGLVPPPAGSPSYFAAFRADEYGDPADALQIFEFRPDFVHPASSTFVERPESRLAVPSFDPRTPPTSRVVEQPSPATSTAYLDAIQDRLLHRLAYRNFGDHESLVLNHTVNVGPNPSTTAGHQSAVRYYELRRPLPSGAFSVTEAATFAPDSANRWMGSAAQDHQGNIAVGYSVSSTTVFPSIRYAGRLASDPPNGLFQGEATLVAGTGVQRVTTARWGDYSAMAVDPSDDCTFWYTNEYYTLASQNSSTQGWLTRIGSFKFPSCTPAPLGTLAGTVTRCDTGAPVPEAVLQVPGGYFRSTSSSGSFSMTLPTGTYQITASRPSLASATLSGLLVMDGQTTDASICLAPAAVIVPRGEPAFVAESCAPTNGGADPGETISALFSLDNLGTGATSDLVATLHSTGGVTSTGPAQSYGSIPPGGPPVGRTFSFRVDPALGCGETIVATLELRDGAEDLGTVSFPISLGDIFREGFDDVAAPALPPGWTVSTSGTGLLPWVTTSTSTFFVSPPNGAGVLSSAAVSESRLESPVLSIPSVPARLSFMNSFSLQANRDGGVLEISLDGGPFTDILASGGHFLEGGYNGFITTGFSSPIAGRDAWTGSQVAGSQAFFLTRVELPPSASGHGIRLRWRAAFDASGSAAGAGWRIDDVKVSIMTCCGAQIAAAPPTSVQEESCAPSNGAPDPDETIVVGFPLRNVGDQASTDLTATLLAGGGVLAPGPAQSYGSLLPGGPSVTRSFRFVPSGECGEGIDATLELRDGAVDLGRRSFHLTLGSAETVLSENFDSVAAPALPPGWIATRPVGTTPPLWASGFESVSLPNSAFTSGAAATSDNRLDSPVIPVGAGAYAELSFHNKYNFESGYDGGVLEVSIGGGAFTDILEAGGNFLYGGYNRTIALASGNPLAGRRGWSGTRSEASPGFITTRVRLPGSVLGQTIRLRWRAGFDAATSPGTAIWRIDDVLVTLARCCNQPCSLTCPDDVSAVNAPGLCGSEVSYPPPGVSGSCGVVDSSPSSGSFFPVGDTLVGVSSATGGACSFQVEVRDVEAPSLVVGALPSILWPPNHQMIDAHASWSVSDNCPGAQVHLDSVTSSEPDDAPGGGDGNTSEDIQGASPGTADADVSLRAERDGSGAGRTYNLAYSASDAAGNVTTGSAAIVVPHDRNGVTDPLSLTLMPSGASTLVAWNTVSGASSYSLIRGNAASLKEDSQAIDLGPVICLAYGPGTSIVEPEGSTIPLPGQVFFYLVAYQDGMGSSYGSPSASKPRIPLSGSCE
jgi:hypothetical protein